MSYMPRGIASFFLFFVAVFKFQPISNDPTESRWGRGSSTVVEHLSPTERYLYPLSSLRSHSGT